MISYGFFPGGDPRTFHPDGPECDPEELANHKAACRLWDEAEERGETPRDEPGSCEWWFDAEGRSVAHVLRARYGIGTYDFDDAGMTP